MSPTTDSLATRAMSNETGTPALGGRFLDALQHAAELHASHPRKGTTVPYVSHLLSVAGLVLEDGGTEDEAIAGSSPGSVPEAAGGL
jgi:(p)ppGpp synthase/HD superfamily hydrolase